MTPHQILCIIGPRIQQNLLALEATELTPTQRSLAEAIHKDALHAAWVASDLTCENVSNYFDGAPEEPEGGAERSGHDKDRPEDPPGGGEEEPPGGGE